MAERREFIGRLIAAGPTRTMTGETGGYVVTAGAIREAVAAGLFRGLACFADHSTGDGAAGVPSVRRLVGVWRDVVWDEAAGAAVGRLSAYETDGTRPVLDLLEQWLDEREGGPDVGVSIVFYPRLAGDGRTVNGITMVESADVVMFPASASSRIIRKYERRGTRYEPGDRRDEGCDAGAAGELRAENSHSQSGHPLRLAHYEQVQSTSGQGPAATPAGSTRTEHGVSALGQTATASGSDRNEHEPSTSGRAATPAGSTRTEHGVSALGQTATASGSTGNGHRPWASMPNQQTKMGNSHYEQERQQMTQQTGSEMVGEPRRVALVRGAGEFSGDGGDSAGWDGAAMSDPTPDGALNSSFVTSSDDRSRHSTLDSWLEALKTAAAMAVIRSSGLPAPVQERLGAGRYETADEVYAAVDRARGELAALTAMGVVRLDGLSSGRRGGSWTGGSPSPRLRDGMDEARDLVGFFFGAADAPTPPNMRSFADLYVALTGDVYFRGVFDGDRVQFSGATTSTLPNLAVDAMNRVIVQQFAALEHYRWYERIAAVEPNDGSLQAMKWITLGGVANLPTVAEGAAYTELDVADVKESAAFVKRGGYVGITREMIKNGEIMQLQAIPRALAAAAVRTRSAAVSALFTAGSGVGPTLAQDSKALFHADHANLATTALGTDAAAWRAARAECFQHVELGSAKPLGIFPRFLLVPAELYDTALSILGYGEGMPAAYSPEAQARGFADPRPIPLVVPDWTDGTDWAYIVDPALFPVIQMSYSQSPGGRRHPIPELFAVVSETSGLMFSNDVLPIKVRDEFAVGVNGARGIGKRNVA